MDPVEFDSDGNMFVAGPAETPQFASGVTERPAQGNGVGLSPLSVNRPVSASFTASPGNAPVIAVDGDIRAWWEAAEGAPQWLTADLKAEFDVTASRTLFADRNLDYGADVAPGPHKYRIEDSTDGSTWTTLLDHSNNGVDWHIEYDTWVTTRGHYVRLVVPVPCMHGCWGLDVHHLRAITKRPGRTSPEQLRDDECQYVA